MPQQKKNLFGSIAAHLQPHILKYPTEKPEYDVPMMMHDAPEEVKKNKRPYTANELWQMMSRIAAEDRQPESHALGQPYGKGASFYKRQLSEQRLRKMRGEPNSYDSLSIEYTNRPGARTVMPAGKSSIVDSPAPPWYVEDVQRRAMDALEDAARIRQRRNPGMKYSGVTPEQQRQLDIPARDTAPSWAPRENARDAYKRKTKKKK